VVKQRNPLIGRPTALTDIVDQSLDSQRIQAPLDFADVTDPVRRCDVGSKLLSALKQILNRNIQRAEIEESICFTYALLYVFILPDGRFDLNSDRASDIP
jgi:hypothetical protein